MKIKRKAIAYIEGIDGELKGEGKPFFRVRLDKAQATELLELLQECSRNPNRQWFTLTSTYEKPKRIRLTEKSTPQYELDAQGEYLRCNPIIISGKERSPTSCNIDFSSRDGARMLAERLSATIDHMRAWVELQVPTRKRPLIELWADIELEARETQEHRRLAETGASLAAAHWPKDDFADWEGHGG